MQAQLNAAVELNELNLSQKCRLKMQTDNDIKMENNYLINLCTSFEDFIMFLFKLLLSMNHSIVTF